MAGAASNKRKRNGQAKAAGDKMRKVAHGIPPSPPLSEASEPRTLSTLISEEEIEITVDTLRTLAEHPSVIKSKPCKELRSAVFDFRQACTTGVNTAADTNLTARISAAITDGKYVDALVALAEMRVRNDAPKLGALCRWVRDLDVISGVSLHSSDADRPKAFRTDVELQKLRVLDGVLRVTGPSDLHIEKSDLSSRGPMIQRDAWDLRDPQIPRLEVRQSVLDRSIFGTEKQDLHSKFKVIETTPGLLRKPPNHHPAVIYLSDNDTVRLDDSPRPVSHTQHPHVPNMSLMKDVFSVEECKAIIAATEVIGFLPDAPIRDDSSESSVLAHNVYWMVDQSFHDKLWARVRACIPSIVDGKHARGINRRFRVYRYVPGAEYRCHIDGAWPPSGLHSVTKAYQYDSSPADAKQSSLFTFLIYLNDEFEGGETTFFIPSVREGVMNAYPVHPVMGAVAMFPHGETKGALLHEGTGVTKGAKYIIRTDVEYDVEPTL